MTSSHQVSHLAAAVVAWTLALLQGLGYGGVVLTMAIQSACIPLPSEVILPFVGYLVHQGRLDLHVAAATATVGGMLGSWAAYAAGRYGGRPFLERYGKYVLVSMHHLDLADRAFGRWGQGMVFVGRLLPIVRSFISLPAGIARMPFGRFTAYSVVGLWIWNYALIYAGELLGARWDAVRGHLHGVDTLVAGLLVIGVAFGAWKLFQGQRAARRQAPSA